MVIISNCIIAILEILERNLVIFLRYIFLLLLPLLLLVNTTPA